MACRRHARVVVLLRCLVADVRKVRPDHAAAALPWCGKPAAFLLHQLLGVIDVVGALGFAIVAMALVTVDLQQRFAIL